MVEDERGRRAAGKADRRERIFEATAELIADGGPDAVSMRRLAAASGLAVNTVYALVGGRDAAVTEVARRRIARVEADFAEPPPELAPTDQVRWLYVEGVRSFFADPVARRLLPVMLDPTSDVYPMMRAATIGLVRAALERAIANGDLAASVPLEVLLDQQYLSFLATLGEWSAGIIDDDQLRRRQDTQALLGMVHLAAGHRRNELLAALEAAAAPTPRATDEQRSVS